MITFIQRVSGGSRGSPLVWYIGVPLLSLGIVLGLTATLAAHDRQPVAGLLPGPQASAGAPDGHIQATEAPTRTIALPLIVKAYPPQAPASAFGVQIYYDQYTLADTIAQMGASWVRLPLNWSEIEPVNTTPANYQWPARFGEGLAQLSARNIKVILTLSGNPSWAATYPGGPIDKTNISELTEFMVAAVSHYGRPPYNVKYWEIYNEPDNADTLYASYGWGYFGHKPKAYVTVLSAIYQPVKAADPEAQIVFGGIAYDNWTTTGGPFIKTFPDDVLTLGGGPYFDVMNFHYYVLFHQNWDPYGTGIIGKYTFLRDKLSSYGLSKPFICTEASMWTDAAHGGSLEFQSRYIPQVFVRTMAAPLQTTIWFMLKDEPDLGVYQYGVLDSDSDPKPGYYTYQTLSRQLANAHYLATLNPAGDGSGQIEAYEFLSGSGPLHIIVAWSRDSLAHPMSLKTAQVVQVDRLGNQTTINAGPDGSVHLDIGACSDGPEWLVIGRCPVYLRFVPTD